MHTDPIPEYDPHKSIGENIAAATLAGAASVLDQITPSDYIVVVIVSLRDEDPASGFAATMTGDYSEAVGVQQIAATLSGAQAALAERSGAAPSPGQAAVRPLVRRRPRRRR